MNTINFTPEKFKSLKKHYKQAVEEKKETFIFESHELLTAYAKYMIQYLETKLKQ